VVELGSLCLHGGRWNGRQVLPAEWVTESTRRRIAVKDSVWSLGETGYGYQWWHDRFKTEGGMIESLSAVGSGQQRIFVLPELRVVVTVLAGRYDDKTAEGLAERLLVRHIVPAVLPRSGPPPGGT
jgi:CubicO group peptidase (beta-lactamase class C family)